ncbi:MAG: hypothetical protein NT093_02720 [Candidatus Moranbacteria bacterium]|nr:hypothetical protein [Candidatus Moranbacteria bacterium]
MFKKAKIKRSLKKIKKVFKNIPQKPEETAFVCLAVLALVFAGMCFDKIKFDINTPTPVVEVKKTVSPREIQIKKIVANSPISEMAPFIAKKNKKVAAYLVAIAKKESNWGVYSPKKEGKECYNYWGYRGPENTTESGYSCFDSPAQAVNIVGNRLGNLIKKKVDTPRDMVLWKCGNNRAARITASAAKWVRDVNLYYKKMM